MNTSARDSVATNCVCEQAAEWAALSYTVEGTAARVIELLPKRDSSECAGRAVVLGSLRRVECVLDSHADFVAVQKRLNQLTDSGWEVWALVPLRRLGEAHLAFQSVANFVQGWWQVDDAVTFTAPEIP